MLRPLRLLVAAAALTFATAAHADDGGTDEDGGSITPTEDAGEPSNDASATVGDMAHRPGAAKASLPGCSMSGGSQAAPLGALVVGGLVLLAARPRRARAMARRTARRRR